MTDRLPDLEAPRANDREVSRRAALAKLGLATGLAYSAPTILHLDRQAKAVILPSCRTPPGVPPDPSCPPAPFP